MSAQSWNDQRIEIIIGTLLRTGVHPGGGGGVVRRSSVPGAPWSRGPELHGVPRRTARSLKSVSDIVHGALGGAARAIIQLGLLLLIATPVARVIFSAIAFAIERDYMYVVITLIVLAVLLYSLFGSG